MEVSESDDQEMEVDERSINSLSHDLIEKILIHLPVRDAMRASILSRRWRYWWASMPVLAFDNNVSSCFSGQKNLNNVGKDILQILQLHTGPIVELTLSIEVEIDFEMDQIIHHLSTSNRLSLKKFSLHYELNPYKYKPVDWFSSLVILRKNRYKLPSSFFSFQGLAHLSLSDCDFEPPLLNNSNGNGFGFIWLRFLSFINVHISANILKHLLTNCPLLESLYLAGNKLQVTRGNNTSVELFACLPLIVRLSISKYYVMYFAAGVIPQKLPTLIVHLRFLTLGVCFMTQHDLSFTLCLIKSSPNLVEICLKLYAQPTSSTDILDLQDRVVGLTLDHLERLKIAYFSNSTIEMEFVKLVMRISPVLTKVRLQLGPKFSIDEELKMCRDLIRQPFPKASPSAELIIERPKHLQELCLM